MPPTDEKYPYVNTINCFAELPMVKEEEEADTKPIVNLKHYYNTRSKILIARDTPPITSSQGTCNTQKITKK